MPARQQAAPSYATVRQIVQALDPALVTLALEGPASYRDRHELVFRRRAERPNHGTPNAVIAHVEGEGQWDRVTILNDRGYGTAVTARLLRRPGSALVKGSEVRIGIGGTGTFCLSDRTRRDYRAALRVMWRVYATSTIRAAAGRVQFRR